MEPVSLSLLSLSLSSSLFLSLSLSLSLSHEEKRDGMIVGRERKREWEMEWRGRKGMSTLFNWMKISFSSIDRWGKRKEKSWIWRGSTFEASASLDRNKLLGLITEIETREEEEQMKMRKSSVSVLLSLLLLKTHCTTDNKLWEELLIFKAFPHSQIFSFSLFPEFVFLEFTFRGAGVKKSRRREEEEKKKKKERKRNEREREEEANLFNFIIFHFFCNIEYSWRSRMWKDGEKVRVSEKDDLEGWTSASGWFHQVAERWLKTPWNFTPETETLKEEEEREREEEEGRKKKKKKKGKKRKSERREKRFFEGRKSNE